MADLAFCVLEGALDDLNEQVPSSDEAVMGGVCSQQLTFAPTRMRWKGLECSECTDDDVMRRTAYPRYELGFAPA